MVFGQDGRERDNEESDTPETEDTAEGYADYDVEDDDDVAEEQFDLDDGEDRLPWLEGDDDEDEGGVDSARILIFAVLAVVILGALLAAIWWFSRDSVESDIEPDGSTIEAPDEPYKTAPDDPGGKTHEGTGDSSFAVAEGQSPEGRIAASPTPTPEIDREQAAESGGVPVQVAAYSSRQAAEEGWQRLVGQFAMLSGYRHRVVEAEVDGNTVYRLQAMASDRGTASSLCASLTSAGGSCQVK